MAKTEVSATCRCDHPREVCVDCARPISPARTVNEALLDIAMRALSCVVKEHGATCYCYACTALTVTSKALIEERHRDDGKAEKGVQYGKPFTVRAPRKRGAKR